MYSLDAVNRALRLDDGLAFVFPFVGCCSRSNKLIILVSDVAMIGDEDFYSVSNCVCSEILCFKLVMLRLAFISSSSTVTCRMIFF